MKTDSALRLAVLRVFFPAGKMEVGRLTLVLLLGSFLVSLLTHFGTSQGAMDYFTITRYRVVDGGFGWKSGLSEIQHGEVWRLFTPFFIHFGIGQLLSNSIWMLIFGTLIEARQGARALAPLVLAIEAASSLPQYLLRGPAFGGMSGVMGGLLGYIWMRGILDPASGLRLDKLVLILGVFVALESSVGLFGNAGQVAHAAGFAAGLVLGVVSGLVARSKTASQRKAPAPGRMSTR